METTLSGLELAALQKESYVVTFGVVTVYHRIRKIELHRSFWLSSCARGFRIRGEDQAFGYRV